MLTARKRLQHKRGLVPRTPGTGEAPHKPRSPRARSGTLPCHPTARPVPAGWSGDSSAALGRFGTPRASGCGPAHNTDRSARARRGRTASKDGGSRQGPGHRPAAPRSHGLPRGTTVRPRQSSAERPCPPATAGPRDTRQAAGPRQNVKDRSRCTHASRIHTCVRTHTHGRFKGQAFAHETRGQGC